jgi:predicted Zn-dependent protease
MEMARFFEKLQSDSGKQSRVAQFFSSHPNPGNRVKSVQALITQLSAKSYSNGDQAAFNRAQNMVLRLPPPKPKKKPEATQQQQEPQKKIQQQVR